MRKLVMIILLGILPWAMPKAEAGNGISEQEFVDFLATLPSYPTASEGRRAVDSLIATVDSDYHQLDDVLDWAAKYLLDERSPMRNEELYDSLFIMDNPGRKALDFNFCDTLGRRTDLYSIIGQSSYSLDKTPNLAKFSGRSSSKPYNRDFEKQDTTILFFYSPDCDHCLSLLRQWHTDPSTLPQAIRTHRVIAISLLDDKDLWQSSISLLPESWLPVYDLDNLLVRHRYDLRHLPHIVAIAQDSKFLPTEQ